MGLKSYTVVALFLLDGSAADMESSIALLYFSPVYADQTMLAWITTTMSTDQPREKPMTQFNMVQQGV